jgi:WD40 repeat protein
VVRDHALTGREIEELAQVFHAQHLAALLLEEAGIPRGRQPAWPVGGTPETFWREMNERLRGGIVDEGTIRLLRAAVRRYPANRVFAAGVAAHPPEWLSGRRLIAAVSGSPLLAVSASTGREQDRDRRPGEGQIAEYRLSQPGEPNSLRAIAFSPDSALLVSFGRDGSARLWYVGTGRDRSPIQQVGSFDHPKPLRRAVFSPDRRMLAVVCADDGGDVAGEVWLWDMAGGRCTHVLPHPVAPSSLVFSSDGSYVVAGGPGYLWRWAVASGMLAGQGSLGGSGSVVEVSADARLVAVAEPGALEVTVADVVGAAPPRRIPVGAAISKIGFSSDGGRLATLDREGVVRLWEPRTGAPVHVFDLDRRPVLGFALSPDGRLLATRYVDHPGRRRLRPRSASGTYTVRVTDLDSGRMRWSFRHDWAPRGLLFGPGGRFLVVYNQARASVYLHELATPTADATPKHLRHDALVSAVAVSLDGRWLAAATDAGTVVLWDLQLPRADEGTI